MIARARLSSDVHQEVLNRIIRGEIAPGQRLKDTELAEELGVSRTPIREALLRLEREGFLSSQKHLGFSVKRLLELEIREVYPLVGLLECSALEAAPKPCPEKLRELRDIGIAMKQEGPDPMRRIELDSAWHEALLADSGNRHRLRILRDLKQLLLRYEYAFMRDEELVLESVAEHNAIALALEQGECRQALKLLGAHWERCSAATLADFLANRGHT